MAESSESYALETFGRIFSISRKALVNDDLGAFANLPRRLGQAAAAFEAAFLVKLLEGPAGLGPVISDGQTLLHGTHGNVTAGGGAAPSTDTLTAARLAMRKQVGLQGNLIAVAPRYLLVPPELETAGEKLLADITPTTTDDVVPFSMLTLIVEPRLKDAKRWWVVADPNLIDGLEFAYLASEPGPQTITELGFEIDGMSVKIRLNYGTGFVDWHGWYGNAGQ